MRDYRQYQVWQRSHQFTLSMYRVTEAFPATERYALATQIRRASFSVPMNIAEGCGKHSDSDFARYLDIAAGSASELDYQLLLSHDLGFIDGSGYEQLSSELLEIRKMLTSLINTVRNTPNQ